MSTGVFSWVKLALENWKTVLGIITLLLSLLGFTVNENLNKTTQIKQTQQQVAAVAESYNAHTVVKEIHEPCNCNLKEHIREYHK